MHIREVLARNLRRLRRDRGISQEALADSADIDRSYISSLERGVYGATIDMVAKLADALGVEASELLLRPKRAPKSDPLEPENGK
jgi:transcriptional regulator with XRE-family HTH domain